MRIWVVAVLILGACNGKQDGGDDNGPADAAIDAPPDAPIGAAMIGPAGGTLVSEDGVLTLTVPPNAVTAATPFAIDVVPAGTWPDLVAADQVGEIYSITPEGTTFAVPATLTWTFASTPANATSNGRARILFGYARAADGTIDGHVSTVSKPAGGALTVVSTINHLSEHLLYSRPRRNGVQGWGELVGTVDIDVCKDRHALYVPWTAPTFELDPVAQHLGVWLFSRVTPPGIVTDRSMSPPWESGETYDADETLQPGTTWPPVLPRFECTSVGVGQFSSFIRADLIGMNVVNGYVEVTEPIECYERVQKVEYTTEATTLGTGRIAPLAVPGIGNVNLADHAGAYGYTVCLAPGQTIKVCTSASMPASVNLYPQYPPGYTFVNTTPAGCTNVTNLDPDNPNCLLVKVSGGGSPNNATVTTSVQ